MSDATIAGLFLIGVPLAFNTAFALLGARFDYPDILRQPTSAVLARFRAGGTSLVLLWWAFALTAVLTVPLVVLLGRAIDDPRSRSWAVPSRKGAGHQRGSRNLSVGPVRRYAVVVDPSKWCSRLDRTRNSRPRSTGRGFETFVLDLDSFEPSPPVNGCALFSTCDLRPIAFRRSNEPAGWKVAERVTPAAYVAWSLWLVATGVALLV